MRWPHAVALALAWASAARADEGNAVRTVEARAVGAKTVVTLHGSARPSFTAYRLDHPPRIVVDVAAAHLDKLVDPIPVDSPTVTSVAASSQPGLVRLVITCKQTSNYRAVAVANDVVVTISADGPALTRPGAGRSLESVEFEAGEAADRVVVAVGGNPTVQNRSRAEEALLRIDGVQLPARLARTLDTRAFHGPVAAVSTFVDPNDPGAVHVVARLSAAVQPTVHKEEGKIVWQFPKPRAAVREEGDFGSYPPARVAGYGLNTLPLQVGAQPAPPPQAPAARPAASLTTRPGPKKYTGAAMDFDFKDIDIHNLLRLISDFAHLNFVVDESVRGAMTLRLHSVPWDQALDIVLRTKGLGMVRDRNVIRIAPQAALDKEIETEIAHQKQVTELKPIITRLVPISYAEASSLVARVQEFLSPRGRVAVDARTNQLIISDIEGNIAQAEALIRNLDTQTPQVLIEARVIEARTNFSRAVGIQWGGNVALGPSTGTSTGLVFPNSIGVAGGTAATATTGLGGGAGVASPNFLVNMPADPAPAAIGLSLGSVAGTVNVNLRLSAAETAGQARTLSAPRITTLDNTNATISQGFQIPVTVSSGLAGPSTSFISANLSLNVKPHVTNDGSVLLTLNISRNEPTTGGTISTKSAQTQMLVRDGDTGVIGGIYSRSSATNFTKVPWLAEIPILGWLFKSRGESEDRSEMLIFVTPRIVNRSVLKR